MKIQNILAALIVASTISLSACVGKVGKVDFGTPSQWVELPGQVGEALLTTPQRKEYLTGGTMVWNEDAMILCMNNARNIRESGDHADADGYEAMCRVFNSQ